MRLTRLLSIFAVGLFTMGPALALTEVPLLQSIVPDGAGEKIAYGIYVKVGEGGAQRLFQFDTGNGSFLAGYASNATTTQFWGTGVTSAASGSYHAGFGSGIEMDFYKVNAQVTLSNAAGDDLVVIPTMVMGQVYRATGDDIPNNTYWNETLVAGDPPLHQTYYGNFGAGVYRGSSGDEPVNEQLFSALGQISGVTGFTVSLSGGNPKLTLVFNTPEDQAYVDSFTYAVSMVGEGGTFPVTGWSAHSEFPTTASEYEVNGVTVSGTTGLFDTGGTSFGLTDEAKTAFETAGLLDGDKVVAGQEFGISFAGAGEVDGQTFEDFTLNFTTGTAEGVNLVTTNTGTSQLNYGPAIYNFYDVYYDLENSVVRFRAVPEPGVIGLVGVGGALLVGRWIRRRKRVGVSS